MESKQAARVCEWVKSKFVVITIYVAGTRHEAVEMSGHSKKC